MSVQNSSHVDLANAFNNVTRELKANQQTLNEVDDYNHNHGDNMVRNFQVITAAMRQTEGSQPSEQLAHASQLLSQQSQSGSAQLYSEGLARAADEFRGQSVITPENAMLLVQALMGTQTAPPQTQNLPDQGSGMDDLLNGLFGGQPAPGQGQQDQGAGDMLPGLGGLLGALMGGSSSQPTHTQAGGQSGGVDLNMLMRAGMAFFQARQQGVAPMQALVQAVMAGSQMQNTPSHAQSGQLVAQTLINSLGSMLSPNQ